MAELEDDGTLGKSILDKVFTVKMPTGKMATGIIFGDNASAEELTSLTVPQFDFFTDRKSRCTFGYESIFNL